MSNAFKDFPGTTAVLDALAIIALVGAFLWIVAIVACGPCTFYVN